jgi:hypothetical protein
MANITSVEITVSDWLEGTEFKIAVKKVVLMFHDHTFDEIKQIKHNALPKSTNIATDFDVKLF